MNAVPANGPDPFADLLEPGESARKAPETARRTLRWRPQVDGVLLRLLRSSSFGLAMVAYIGGGLIVIAAVLLIVDAPGAMRVVTNPFAVSQTLFSLLASVSRVLLPR